MFNRALLLSVLMVIITQSLQSPVDPASQKTENLDVDISCLVNSACLTNVANKVVRALHTAKAIDFGSFSIEPKKNAKKVEGRSMSKLWELTANNAVRVPLGSYSLTLQKSDEYKNYYEVAVSKTVEGKNKL